MQDTAKRHEFLGENRDYVGTNTNLEPARPNNYEWLCHMHTCGVVSSFKDCQCILPLLTNDTWTAPATLQSYPVVCSPYRIEHADGFIVSVFYPIVRGS